MKRTIPFSALLAACLAFAAEEALTVSQLLQEASKLDGKAVFVSGMVSGFEQKTSRKGNKYFLFKMKNEKEVVNVYSRGEMSPALKDGDKVNVRGIFRVSKTVGDFTVKNEVDASAVKEKPYGVKKID